MSANTLVVQFELQTRLFLNVLEGIKDESALLRASEDVNHVKWLAAHLLAIRLGLSHLGGLPEDTSMQHYTRKSVTEINEYPDLTTIKARWEDVSNPIQQGIAALTAEELAAAAPFQVPISDPSYGGYLGFLMHHEAYHLGQLGLLRKYLGQEAMAYA